MVAGLIAALPGCCQGWLVDKRGGLEVWTGRMVVLYEGSAVAACEPSGSAL